LTSLVRCALSAAAAFALLLAPSAGASERLLVGLFDETQTLYGNPDYAFPLLHTLGADVVRVNLYWGGRFGVARRAPANPAEPADPAYHWEPYDRTVRYAKRFGMRVLFSIYGTPSWENGGAGLNRPPSSYARLEAFAAAAAARYSGTFVGADGLVLPAVRHWLAWNEPNNPIFLSPQYRRAAGRWVVESARAYARICAAVWHGVHAGARRGEKVACGGTAPRGNNNPRSARPSVSPLAFLRALHRTGRARFDVYAHHPYARAEAPSARPPGPTAVTLGNLGVLLAELTRLYGPKRLWITEYGYQTNPPDRAQGVTAARQARYVTEAYAIARSNPRVDMLVWFLLRDEARLDGWQSGFITAGGKKKPSFFAFQRLRPAQAR
jgi:hypothetical protein